MDYGQLFIVYGPVANPCKYVLSVFNTTPEAAREAVDSYHGTQLYGRFQIIVRPYFSPSNRVKQSNTRQHRSVGSSKTSKTSSKPQRSNTQQPQQQQQQLKASQPKVHPRRGRVTTAPMSPQVSPNCKPEHDAATNSKSETAATQQVVVSSATEQKEGLVMGDSATQSLVADYTIKQGSSINVDSQDSCPWPDIVPATTIEPIFLTEPDDMLSEPDSSQQPSLNDLLLNPALSAKQIQDTLPYEQSHQCPVPLASAGPTSSHPSSSPTFIRLAITNLSTEADEDDLIPFLDLNGKLISLVLVSDGSSKTATVAYPSLSKAQEAIAKWHGCVVYGLPVSVSIVQDMTQPHPPPPSFPSGMLPHPLEPIKIPISYPCTIPPQPMPLETMIQPHMNYSIMQPNNPPPFNYPTSMPQSADSFPTMQPITGMPRVQRKSVQRRISLRLYGFTKTTTEGKDFERNGGSLQYSETDGCLLISADPLETAELFANGVVDRLCERDMPLSLKQLTQLAESKPNRPSLFDELCSPFITNPNVKIVLLVEYGQGKEPAVTFVGLTEAVNSAYLHFTGSLLKEFEMNK